MADSRESGKRRRLSLTAIRRAIARRPWIVVGLLLLAFFVVSVFVIYVWEQDGDNLIVMAFDQPRLV